MLVRTYAGALDQVSDQTVTVRPFRGSPDDKDVLVRTEVKGAGDPIQLDYRLEKTPGEGSGWKIYNLNVLGIWLVDTYKTQFAQEINSKGIDGPDCHAGGAQQGRGREELTMLVLPTRLLHDDAPGLPAHAAAGPGRRPTGRRRRLSMPVP